MIYLDNAATTPIDPSVLAVMNEINQSSFANPSSIHSAGQRSKVILENARKTVARSIKANPGEIVFTSGGTEANNFALTGIANANRDKGNHIITSKVEHPSVLETCKHLAKSGFRISYIDVNNRGLLNLDQLKRIIDKETILISLMMVNNETGCLLPIKEVGKYIEKLPIIFHTDAVQALDKIDININKLNIDLVSLSSHKIYGPKGCGALYIRSGTIINPILFGGSQERAKRSGTENVSAICGFAEAINQMQIKKKEIQPLVQLFENELKVALPGIEINGEDTPRAPGISNVYFPFMSGDSILMNLDLHDIAVSTGSACSSGSQKPSHVLQSMGFKSDRINNSVRFSMGRETSKEEILKTIEVLKKIYNKTINKTI